MLFDPSLRTSVKGYLENIAETVNCIRETEFWLNACILGQSSLLGKVKLNVRRLSTTILAVFHPSSRLCRLKKKCNVRVVS